MASERFRRLMPPIMPTTPAPAPAVTTFAELGLPAELVTLLTAKAIVTPTPVQAAVIPLAMLGGDILAQARTGSGKTLAFLLPLATRIVNGEINRAWIICPTRELAQQAARTVEMLLGPNQCAVVVGGQPAGPQIRDLRRGTPLVIGTPGRMCDLLAQGNLKPDADILVLDEADQMLDLGFKEDLESLVKDLGNETARWCFSATFPPDVQRAVTSWLEEPRIVKLDTVSGSAHVPGRYVVTRRGEEALALARLLHLLAPSRAMVFVRTREDVERCVRAIAAEGIEAAGISGELAQEARERVLARFRDGHLPVLVGTDVAARGIDVPGVTHVFNLGLPMGAEAYTHRIGRTARAGAGGEAWTVLTAMERSRFLRLVHIAGCKAEERPLPTGAALVAAKRERLARRVSDGLGEARPLPEAFAALVTEHGAVEVLSALVHRLCPDAPPEKPLPVIRPGSSPMSAPGAGNRGPARGAGTSIYIGIGLEDVAGAGPIVAMLCRIPGIEGSKLGRISCFQRHSLVEVDPGLADSILNAKLVHRGRPVSVRPDHGAPMGGGGAAPRAPYRKPFTPRN